MKRTAFSPYTEHEIQQQCISYLRTKGFYTMRLNSGKYSIGEGSNKRFIMGQEKGTPDIIAFKAFKDEEEKIKGLSQILFVEVKRPSGKVSLHQKFKMQELIQYGATCIVVHSIEELQKSLLCKKK